MYKIVVNMFLGDFMISIELKTKKKKITVKILISVCHYFFESQMIRYYLNLAQISKYPIFSGVKNKFFILAII